MATIRVLLTGPPAGRRSDTVFLAQLFPIEERHMIPGLVIARIEELPHLTNRPTPWQYTQAGLQEQDFGCAVFVLKVATPFSVGAGVRCGNGFWFMSTKTETSSYDFAPHRTLLFARGSFFPPLAVSIAIHPSKRVASFSARRTRSAASSRP